MRSMRAKYTQHLNSAKKRGLQSSLSYSNFYSLKVGDCHYCSIPNMLLGRYMEYMGFKTNYMTIDRKNNSKGYTKENTVSCCALCNRTKSNLFGYKEFKEIAEIYIAPKWQKFKDEVEDDFDEWCFYEGPWEDED